MLLRVVAACFYCPTLGSYIAIFLIIEALLQTTLLLIPLVLKQLSLPDEALVNNLIYILRFRELDYYRGGRFYRRRSG